MLNWNIWGAAHIIDKHPWFGLYKCQFLIKQTIKTLKKSYKYWDLSTAIFIVQISSCLFITVTKKGGVITAIAF